MRQGRRLPALMAAGLAFLAIVAGNVPLARARSEKVVTSVGPVAVAVAVDQRAGRAFIVSANMDTRNGGLTGQGFVSVLDPHTGTLLRTITVGLGAATLAVDERTGHAIVANQGNLHWYKSADGTDSYRAMNPSLSLLDTQTGRVLRTIRLGGTVPYALAVNARTSRLFVATGPMPANTPGVSGAVRTLDTRTGALLGTVSLQAIPPLDSRQMAVDETAGHVFVDLPNFGSPPGASTLRILDARTGALGRAVPVGRDNAAMLLDRQTHHLLVTDARDNTLIIVDTRTGGVVRTLTMGQAFACLAVDARAGHVFCTMQSGQMRLLDTRTGALVHSSMVGLPAALAVDATASRLLVLTERRPLDCHNDRCVGMTVHVLDTRSGAVLRTLPVAHHLFLTGPLQPVMAVDERTDRAFVTDMARNSVWVLDARSGTVRRIVTLRPTGGVPRH